MIKITNHEDLVWRQKTITKFDLDENTLKRIEANIIDSCGEFEHRKVEYSSDGMNQLENLIYLIDIADKQFPPDFRILSAMVYSELMEFSYSKGIEDLTKIVLKFIDATDTTGRFNYL